MNPREGAIKNVSRWQWKLKQQTFNDEEETLGEPTNLCFNFQILSQALSRPIERAQWDHNGLGGGGREDYTAYGLGIPLHPSINS